MTNEKLLLRIGVAIRERRLAHGMSQEAFADSIGMHRTYYSAIERGERNMTVQTLLKVASALGAKPSEIFAQAQA
jgi:transcriptional regulator with XRE-family HTH domain